MANYIEIGYTQKTHGVKGELKVFVEEPFLDVFLEKKRVFLDIKGSKVPHFIAHVRGAFEDIIGFEDIRNREDALTLQSRKMYLLDSDLPDDLVLEEEALQYARFAGFTLIDQHLGKIGMVEEVLEMPQQEMALLRYKNREVLVPLNEQLILNVDEEKKEILMDLPDGLLSI